MHPEQSGFTDGGSFVADVGPGLAAPFDGFANGEHGLDACFCLYLGNKIGVVEETT